MKIITLKFMEKLHELKIFIYISDKYTKFSTQESLKRHDCSWNTSLFLRKKTENGVTDNEEMIFIIYLKDKQSYTPHLYLNTIYLHVFSSFIRFLMRNVRFSIINQCPYPILALRDVI